MSQYYEVKWAWAGPQRYGLPYARIEYLQSVKQGSRPPSGKLIQLLKQFHSKSDKRNGVEVDKAIDLFLKSRREGTSPRTIEFYALYLTKAVPTIGLMPTPRDINNYLNSLSCSIGGKHAYFRAISVFFN
ncbi:hypothetical protein ACFLWB_00935 [Chloroflexota bacterium]